MKNEDLRNILKKLDSNGNIQELIDNIVEENYRTNQEKLYDKKGNFIYMDKINDFLNNNEITKQLSINNLNVILETIIELIKYRIEIKHQATKYATETEDIHTYYFLLNKALNELNYDKSLDSIYEGRNHQK